MSVLDASTSEPADIGSPASRGSALLGRLTKADAVLGSLLAIATVALFYRFILRQAGPGGFSAKHFEDWGHAYFVPVVSGFYIWKNRHTLARIRIQPYWPGITLLPLAVVTYVYFILNYPIHMFQGAAMVLAIAGLVLFIAGPVAMRALAFPIGYLLLAVTISEAVMNQITWPLKQIASQGSYIMLNMIGVETEIQGNILYISKGAEILPPLNVADACSGMRMVVAFLALGTAVAFLAGDAWWKRIAIMSVAIPVAIFMNIVRVAVLGIVSLINPALATGEAHTMIGTVLLVPAFLLFMGLVKVFDTLFVTEADADAKASKKSGKPTPVKKKQNTPTTGGAS